VVSFILEGGNKARLFEIFGGRSRSSGSRALVFCILANIHDEVRRDNRIPRVCVQPFEQASLRYLMSVADGPTASGGLDLRSRFECRCIASRFRGVVAYLSDLRSRRIRKAQDMGTQGTASICGLVTTKCPKRARERSLQRCYRIML